MILAPEEPWYLVDARVIEMSVFPANPRADLGCTGVQIDDEDGKGNGRTHFDHRKSNKSEVATHGQSGA